MSLWENIKQLGGGRGVEYLLAGALAVVIIGAVALSVVSFLGGDEDEVPIGDPVAHFQCQVCKKEWTSRFDELPEGAVGPGGIERALDCPLCGAKNSSLHMTKCVNPDCGKYFVPAVGESPMDPRVRPVCPYCKTDQLEWRRQERKKKKEQSR